MVSKRKKEIGREHKEIEEYLMQDNGKNLQLLEPNLVIFSSYVEPQSDSIEDAHQLLSEADRMEDLLSHDVDIKLLIKTNADFICFNDNALVIVEIKSSSEVANYKTFGQILYYLTKEKYKLTNTKLLRHINGKEVKEVRGIVLANKFDYYKSLKRPIEEYKNVTPVIILKSYYWNDERVLIIEDI